MTQKLRPLPQHEVIKSIEANVMDFNERYIPVYEICESVERLNYLKRKTRILEGSKAIAKHFLIKLFLKV